MFDKRFARVISTSSGCYDDDDREHPIRAGEDEGAASVVSLLERVGKLARSLNVMNDQIEIFIKL